MSGGGSTGREKPPERAEKAGARIRRAAEREHRGAPAPDDRRRSDSDAAKAHPDATDPRLRRGHPPGGDWRDHPVEEEGDKDIKEGGIEGAARRVRGRP
jgi:hypothetical protein